MAHLSKRSYPMKMFFFETTFSLPNLFSRYSERLQKKNYSRIGSSLSRIRDDFYQGVFGKASKELLAFSAPIDLENISSETLAQYLAELARNRIKAEKADQLKQATSNSFGVKFAQEAFTFQLRSMIEQLKFIESQIKETERNQAHNGHFKFCYSHNSWNWSYKRCDYSW